MKKFLAPMAIAIAALTTPWQSFAQSLVPPPAPVSRLPHNWILPVEGKITNPFGNSYYYFQIYRGGHTGVDISAPSGTPIKAVADGKVVRIFTKPNQRYGQYIVIQHDPKLFSLYGHLRDVQVKPGQQIKQGQQIATVGVTGAAGYPHLHIEALDRLPRFDGAWGYLYICRQLSDKHSFVNQNAFVINAIQRQGPSGCGPRSLQESLTYYNPEALWSPKLVTRAVAQPENEEWGRYQRMPKPAAVQASPLASISPVARPEPATRQADAPKQQRARSAAPDKAIAPEEE